MKDDVSSFNTSVGLSSSLYDPEITGVDRGEDSSISSFTTEDGELLSQNVDPNIIKGQRECGSEDCTSFKGVTSMNVDRMNLMEDSRYGSLCPTVFKIEESIFNNLEPSTHKEEPILRDKGYTTIKESSREKVDAITVNVKEHIFEDNQIFIHNEERNDHLSLKVEEYRDEDSTIEFEAPKCENQELTIFKMEDVRCIGLGPSPTTLQERKSTHEHVKFLTHNDLSIMDNTLTTVTIEQPNYENGDSTVHTVKEPRYMNLDSTAQREIASSGNVVPLTYKEEPKISINNSTTLKIVEPEYDLLQLATFKLEESVLANAVSTTHMDEPTLVNVESTINKREHNFMKVESTTHKEEPMFVKDSPTSLKVEDPKCKNQYLTIPRVKASSSDELEPTIYKEGSMLVNGIPTTLKMEEPRYKNQQATALGDEKPSIGNVNLTTLKAQAALSSLWDSDHAWIDAFDRIICAYEPRIRTPVPRTPISFRKYNCDNFSRADDETDRCSVKSGGSIGKSRSTSVPPNRRGVAGFVAPGKQAMGTAAGAMDEASFFAAFEEVPKITIYNAKCLDETLLKIRECIQDTNNEWDKRIESIKKIRSVLVSGGLDYEEFYSHLRLLEPAMEMTIKDLRSQVVREACITVAYLSQELQGKLDHFCERVLPCLVNLIPNTVKVMASASVVCIRFIIRNTHHHKLIPILTRELASKSKEIRKTVAEFIDQLVHTWPSHTMDRHVTVLSEAIKKGICDADPEARAHSRKAYCGFAHHFKCEADQLLSSLDPSYRKMLQVELNGSAVPDSSTSSHSRPASRPWSRASSAAGSTENIAVASQSSALGGSMYKRWAGPSSIPSPHSRPPPASYSLHTPSSSLRSNSAIDLQAVRRSQTRAQYAYQNRMKAGSGVSLPRPRKPLDHPPISTVGSSDRVARSRNKGGVSQSQPVSRSGSPSSRLTYATYGNESGAGSTPGRARRVSGIPRSTGTSRDPSPNRLRSYGSPVFSPSKSRSRSISGSCDMPPQIPSRPRQVMAHKILQQSREAENALADALVSLPPNLLQRSPARRQYGVRSEEHSDNESEASSVCSDRSFDSYRRNEYSRYSPSQRVPKDMQDQYAHPAEINEILLYCASTNWKDRKEGLAALLSYLSRDKQVLSITQLRRVTNIFTKMFVDTTTKAYSLFLDTVMALISVHSADLQDWLYILLKRLLTKLGGDLLGSVQSKIHTTLDLIRDSFKCELQFQVLMRFLTDPTQTLNTKVKVAALTYLKCLVDVMDGGELLCCSQDAPIALAKILAWTADQKSVEVRRASSAAFIAMFNCNMTDLMNLVQQLPEPCQNTASQLIQNHLRRAASLDASPSSMPSWSSPSTGGTPTVVQSPNAPYSRPCPSRPSRSAAVEPDLHPDEVSKNLKKTMDEIRNYSFELDGANDNDKQRDSMSQDSGISQLSVGGVVSGVGDAADHQRGVLPDHHEQEENGVVESCASSSSSNHRNFPLDSSGSAGDLATDERDDASKDNGSSYEADSDLMNSIIFELSSKESNCADEDRNDEHRSSPEKRAALTDLCRLARYGSPLVWNNNFRPVLRLLLEVLGSDDTATRVLVLSALTQMVRRSCLVQHFLGFSELIILRVLKAHGDSQIEVVRGAHACSSSMAEILPPDVIVRILKPLVYLAEWPLNQAAIKTLHKVVEAHPRPVVSSMLPEVMPGLMKAYDDKMSSVRKAAVFCMVALHNAVGEDVVRPHLASLSGSKLKLLNLYIRRSEERSSGASSPKSEGQV